MNEEILSKLDWNLPKEVQENGIKKAKESKQLYMFIQPNTEKYNKNVWTNCSKVIISKTDEELIPFLIPLLEWLQDLNWPGSENIFERLLKINKEIIIDPILFCIVKSEETNDYLWKSNLEHLLSQI